MVNEDLTALSILTVCKIYSRRLRFLTPAAAFFMVLFVQSWPSPAVLAADAEGAFRVFGAGELPCGRWLADRLEGNPSAKQSEMWVAGYLTAYNQFVFREADITDPYGGAFVLEWLDGYCREHPSDGLVVAVRQLLETLRRRR